MGEEKEILLSGNICAYLTSRLMGDPSTPCFYSLFDYTESYYLSFNIFIGVLFTSAVLSLCLRPPTK